MNKKAGIVVAGISAIALGAFLFGRKAEAQKYICPIDGLEFDTYEELLAHYAIAHPNKPLPKFFNLTISIVGSGTTDPAAGQYEIVEETSVRITVKAVSGWQFDHWEGTHFGYMSPTEAIVGMTEDRHVIAVFVLETVLPGEATILQVTWSQDGQTWHPITDPIPSNTYVTHRFRVKNDISSTTFRVGYTEYDDFSEQWHWNYSPNAYIEVGMEGNVDWSLIANAGTRVVAFYLFADDGVGDPNGTPGDALSSITVTLIRTLPMSSPSTPGSPCYSYYLVVIAASNEWSRTGLAVREAEQAFRDLEAQGVNWPDPDWIAAYDAANAAREATAAAMAAFNEANAVLAACVTGG